MTTAGPSSYQESRPKRKGSPLREAEKIPKLDEEDDDHLYYKKNKGSVNNLHGNIYQLKVQMLILKRALENDYEFQLGTEVEDADKFDDIVFKYRRKNELGNFEMRFVQVKHKGEKNINKIKAKDLLSANSKGDFTLQKYFKSYCTIKNKSEFNTCNLKDFIIYTNSDLDKDDLSKCLIETEEIEENGDILNLSSKTANRFKLLVPDKHKLYEILKETSDLRILVNELKQTILNKKPLHLTNDVFKLYQDVLGLKVFRVTKRNKKRTAKFREEFLNDDNLSDDVKTFRKVLLSYFDFKDNNHFREIMSKVELNVSEKFAPEEEPTFGIKTQLPTNEIDDTEIKDFLDKFVIAANQPNEIDLGKMITREMGEISQFNLLDASLVADSFQRVMLDWFKEKRALKDKEGEWLDSKRGKLFMNSIEKNVRALISIGISIAYPDELASFNIKFNDNNKTSLKIRNFLSKGNALKKILSIISPDETKLSAINVFNTINDLKHQEEFKQFEKRDSYVFIHLKTLLGEKTQPYLIDVFKSIDIYHLLIVDCTFSGPLCDLAVKTLYDTLYEILLKLNKKVIIISKEHNPLFDLFADDLRLKVIDNTNFIDLNEHSQKLLLEKQVLLQGQNVCLNALIDQANDEEKKMIDVALINSLIHGEEIYIGNKLEALRDINDYYIKRKFRVVAFSKDILRKYLGDKDTESDLFVVCGVDIALKHDNLYVFDNVHSAKNKFTELVVTNPKSNIHWLESDPEQFNWHKSYGSISNLIPYKIRSKFSVKDNDDKKRKSPYCIEEDELIREDNVRDKIVIISDTAGMGKSTVLAHLSMQLQTKSTVWIIRINLNDCRDDLKKLYNSTSQVESIDNILDFLWNVGMIYKGKSKLEHFLLKNSFSKHKNNAFFIDGFDEISPDFKEEVIALLRLLQRLKVKYIFVTTRPNVIEELEKIFNVFSYSLEPFSKKEQITFLTNFWTKKLELKIGKYTKRLQAYAELMIRQFSERIHDKKQEFLSIPLQTMMLAEVFQENIKGVSSEWNDYKEPSQPGLDVAVILRDITLIKLYDKFIEKKFSDLCTNKDKNATILTKKYKKEKAEKDFKKDNSLLALKLLFSHKQLQTLLSEEDIYALKSILEALICGEHNEGIVDYIKDDKPHFIHRTFAEYFASFPIAQKILTEPSETLDCINIVLINLSPIFMHGLINQLDGKQESISTQLKMPLLRYVLIKDSANFLKLLLHSNYTDWPKKLDSNSKTPLHYAAEINTESLKRTSHRYAEAAHVSLLNYADDINESEILKHGSFKHPHYENSVLVKFINVQDIHGKTALNYYLESDPRDYDMAFDLLLKGATVDCLTDDSLHALINHMLHSQHSKDETNFKGGILGVYADQENKYRPIQEKIFLKAPGFFHKLSQYEKCRILSYLFVHGRVKVIDVLLGTINDLEERKGLLNADDNGYTPLDRVLGSSQLSDNERLEITKYLEKHGGTKTNCNSYNYYGSASYITMTLMAAAEHGHIETLKYFVSQEDCDNFSYIQHQACQYNQETIISYLRNLGIGTQNSDGNTPLHSACDSGAKLEIIQNLISTGDINAVNKKGETPLFMAVYARNLNVVKYLADNGANLNWKDKLGKTPLFYAFGENHDEEKIIAYLVTKGAVLPKNAPRLLMDKICFFTNVITYNIDLIDVNGCPRLHAAIVSGNYDFAKFLVRHGANINNVDSKGNAPLHLCLKNTEIVETLLQYGASFDIKDSQNRTPLDLIDPVMTSKKNDDKVFWLLKKLQQLFYSQHLSRDLREFYCNAIFKLSSSNKFRSWGPYGEGYPDASDSSNPMRFFLNAQNNKGKTLLHIASDMNDNEAVCRLLTLNDDYLKEKRQRLQRGNYQYKDYQATSIDTKDSDGNFPIHLAAQKGHIEVIYSLLREGAIFCGENYEGQTPEVLAANNDHDNVVELFQPIKNLFNALQENVKDISDVINYIQANGYINVKDQYGKTPLHIAASFSEVAVVQSLIHEYANVNATDLKKETPLHVAAGSNKIKNVVQLLNHGAIYNAKNTQSRIPFDVAKGQCRELLKYVDQLFRDVQSDNPRAVVSNLSAMRNVYENNIIAVTNARDHKENTVLHYAAEIGEFMVVVCLLENGAMYNLKNKSGLTPAQVTNSRNIENYFKIINNMFENIKNIRQGLKSVSFEVIKNVRDWEGHDLLYHATISDESDVIKLLNKDTADDL